MVDEVNKTDDTDQAAESNDSPTLEATIEAKMAALRDNAPEDEKDDESQSVDNETPDATEESDDSEPESKETSDESKEGEDDSLMLPSGHRRAALARGYTNEEIDYALQTKADDAIERFGEIYDEWQKDNSRWSQRGRQLQEADQTAPAASGDQSPGVESSKDLAHLDVAALIEEHGNEDLINALVAPMNAVVDRVNEATAKLSASENFARKAEADVVDQMVQEFLGSKEMKSYRDTYGTKVRDLTDAQAESRMKLCGHADMMMAGAQEQGVGLTIPDALERAHTIMSQGSRDEAIRQTIRDGITKRTKTTKSSHRKTVASDSDQVVTEDELVKRTETRLRELRNK